MGFGGGGSMQKKWLQMGSSAKQNVGKGGAE